MSGTDDDSSLQLALQEENFVLKTQVTKLQLALKTALSRQKNGGSSSGGSTDQEGAYVSKQQLDVVMGHLAELRLQVSQLHEENRSLQAQLEHVREAQLASTSSSGGTDLWEAPAAAAAEPEAASREREPVSRSDMAFIEREINCLKQKISETRLKLEAAEPATPNENEYRAGLVGDRGRPAVQQRQPLQQRKQVAANRPGAGPGAAAAPGAQHRLDAIDLSNLNLFRDLLPRGVATRPSSATGSAVPSAPRTRASHGHGGVKKAGGHKQAKENAANQHTGAGLSSRSKAQRGRGLAY
ncbi:hypothetical protein PLESTM_002067400 [Pleodorina starrii]|nr:hypothetical protein PLESTM_002067400 [Pleodorina starrii]